MGYEHVSTHKVDMQIFLCFTRHFFDPLFVEFRVLNTKVQYVITRMLLRSD